MLTPVAVRTQLRASIGAATAVTPCRRSTRTVHASHGMHAQH